MLRIPTAQTYSLLHIYPEEGWGDEVGGVQHTVTFIDPMFFKHKLTLWSSRHTVYCQVDKDKTTQQYSEWLLSKMA